MVNVDPSRESRTNHYCNLLCARTQVRPSRRLRSRPRPFNKVGWSQRWTPTPVRSRTNSKEVSSRGTDGGGASSVLSVAKGLTPPVTGTPTNPTEVFQVPPLSLEDPGTRKGGTVVDVLFQRTTTLLNFSEGVSSRKKQNKKENCLFLVPRVNFGVRHCPRSILNVVVIKGAIKN